AGRTSDGNGSHWSTSKTPSYTKSVSWQHHRPCFHTLAYTGYGRRGRSVHYYR
ncbi:transposase, partial [Escherichia coli]|nr:transposase [Escherichia coli]